VVDAPSSLVRSGSINKMKVFSIGVDRRLEPALSTPRYLREDRCDCLHGTSARSTCYADVVLVADDFHECDVRTDRSAKACSVERGLSSQGSFVASWTETATVLIMVALRPRPSMLDRRAILSSFNFLIID
jgi:hypothetical protein